MLNYHNLNYLNGHVSHNMRWEGWEGWNHLKLWVGPIKEGIIVVFTRPDYEALANLLTSWVRDLFKGKGVNRMVSESVERFGIKDNQMIWWISCCILLWAFNQSAQVTLRSHNFFPVSEPRPTINKRPKYKCYLNELLSVNKRFPFFTIRIISVGLIFVSVGVMDDGKICTSSDQ